MSSERSKIPQTEAQHPAAAEPNCEARAIGRQLTTIGPVLRSLRGTRSLRQVHDDTGITYSYLSNIERGHKLPGEKVLTRLADYHNVPLGELRQIAGFRPTPEADQDFSNADIRCGFKLVLEDPELAGFQIPAENVPIETQRFVVELYEHFTGKRLLT